jgi:hypothetical protein
MSAAGQARLCEIGPDSPTALHSRFAQDVSDRVEIDGETYIVVEMALLSSIFRKLDGKVRKPASMKLGSAHSICRSCRSRAHTHDHAGSRTS